MNDQIFDYNGLSYCASANSLLAQKCTRRVGVDPRGAVLRALMEGAGEAGGLSGLRPGSLTRGAASPRARGRAAEDTSASS